MEQITLNLAGLGFRIESPIPLALHPHYLPFQADGKDPDVIIRVCCDVPVYPKEPPVFANGRLAVYRTPFGWMREHCVWAAGEKDPENPCLVPQADGSFRLLIPAHRLASLADRNELLWLLAPEARLLEHERLLLHASSVILDGKAYVFCGPAGIGKSTHAALWAACFDAVPLSGDRTVLQRTETGFLAYGSPFCGSSEICVQASAPLGGLCVLAQAAENRMERLSASEAFRLLYAQTTVNSWDRVQIQTISELLIALVGTLPICRLLCRPDPDAARLCLHTLSRSHEEREEHAPTGHTAAQTAHAAGGSDQNADQRNL